MSRGAAAQPLLYLSTQDLGQQLHTQGILQVSADGGKTWEAAPNPDPTAGREFLGPLGALRDGSVIVASLPTLGAAAVTFIAWKSGESAWHELAPPVGMTYLLVTPGADGGNGTLWLVTSTQQGASSVYPSWLGTMKQHDYQSGHSAASSCRPSKKVDNQ